jgi:hypothetical protein
MPAAALRAAALATRIKAAAPEGGGIVRLHAVDERPDRQVEAPMCQKNEVAVVGAGNCFIETTPVLVWVFDRTGMPLWWATKRNRIRMVGEVRFVRPAQSAPSEGSR